MRNSVALKSGSDDLHYIAGQISRLTLEGDASGVAMWKEVARRFGGLNHPKAKIQGQLG